MHRRGGHEDIQDKRRSTTTLTEPSKHTAAGTAVEREDKRRSTMTPTEPSKHTAANTGHRADHSKKKKKKKKKREMKARPDVDARRTSAKQDS